MKLFKVYNFKKLLPLFVFFITLMLLFIFSKQNFISVKNTINIFLFNVMPSLFPFILFTEIILKTDIIQTISNLFGNITNKMFKLSKNSTPCIIIGFLCGFPLGAKSVISNLENNKITYKEASILLSFTNNCNPIFIISTIALNIFGSFKIGIILLFSHIVSSLIYGIISSRYINNNIIHENNEFLKYLSKNNAKIMKKTNNKNFFDIVRTSLLNSFITLQLILGFMIIFNMLANEFNIFFGIISLPNNFSNIFTSIFEITNGCYNIGMTIFNTKLKIMIISFLLGFSGLCIIFQIYSVIYCYGFKLKKLVIDKIIHGILSFILTYIILSFITIDYDSVVLTFSNSDFCKSQIQYTNILYSYVIQITVILFILLSYYLIKKNRYIKK